MNKTLHMLGALIAVSSTSASAAMLVAGWDNFLDGAGNPFGLNPTFVAADTTATLATSSGHNAWDDWNNNNLGASGDGTFGNLSITVASADSAYQGSSNSGQNLSLNRSNGTLVFTLTNHSGSDRTLEGFYFDASHRFAAANAWELSFGGAISGTAASGGVLENNTGMNAASSARRDKAVDLTALTDNVWEAGSEAVFTLAFTGAANSGSGGGVELTVDNIGITAVPEPSLSVLLGLAGAGWMVIRRRTR